MNTCQVCELIEKKSLKENRFKRRRRRKKIRSLNEKKKNIEILENNRIYDRNKIHTYNNTNLDFRLQ